MSKKHNWYFVKEKNKTKQKLQKQSELKNFIDFLGEKNKAKCDRIFMGNKEPFSSLWT